VRAVAMGFKTATTPLGVSERSEILSGVADRETRDTISSIWVGLDARMIGIWCAMSLNNQCPSGSRR